MAKEFFTEEQYKAGIVEKPTRTNFKDIEGKVIGKLTVPDNIYFHNSFRGVLC